MINELRASLSNQPDLTIICKRDPNADQVALFVHKGVNLIPGEYYHLYQLTLENKFYAVYANDYDFTLEHANDKYLFSIPADIVWDYFYTLAENRENTLLNLGI